MGGLTRPMVVGDRLWLFSQSPLTTPPPVSPVRNLMLKESIAFADAKTSHKNDLINQQQQQVNSNHSLLFKPVDTVNVYQKVSAPMVSTNPLAGNLSNLELHESSLYHQFIRNRGAGNITGINGSCCSYMPDLYLQSKYHSFENAPIIESTTTSCGSNGLAELERVFGKTNPNSEFLQPTFCEQIESTSNSDLKSEGSEIDCVHFENESR